MSIFSHLPDIPESCFAVTAVDPNTGKLLGKDGQMVRDGVCHYIVFESQDLAENYARIQVDVDPLSEWIVIDRTGKHFGRFRNNEAISKAQEAVLKANKESEGTWLGWFKRFFT